ncbi:GTPase [uncultured Megasphaera sp.]|uniref:GTPase n=1 Tax=uncultured Megasphaera sp. TaxID=165188 RepID=UPI0025D83D99|nr:GTPase [uncultured Megasphaera sp.]
MQSVAEHLEKIKAEFEKQRQILASQGEKVYIVNAGNMNHGKSSMFNSLLDKEAFKTEDIRTTVTCDEAPYRDNVIFVDTPGIGATAADDATAAEAYKKANLILFVHNPSVGELHAPEVDQIKKLIKLFPENADFWKRFCLVLTYKETDKEQSLDTIQQHITDRIFKEFKVKDFPVFRISNTRYQKGRSENKKVLVDKSGVLELRSYIDGCLEALKKDSMALQVQRLTKLKEETCREINNLKNNVEHRKTTKQNHLEKQGQSILTTIGMYAKQERDFQAKSRSISSNLSAIKYERDKLKKRWENERY